MAVCVVHYYCFTCMHCNIAHLHIANGPDSRVHFESRNFHLSLAVKKVYRKAPVMNAIAYGYGTELNLSGFHLVGWKPPTQTVNLSPHPPKNPTVISAMQSLIAVINLCGPSIFTHIGSSPNQTGFNQFHCLYCRLMLQKQLEIL